MLRQKIRELHRGPAAVDGSIAPGDPAFDGLDLGLHGPVEVGGMLQATADGAFLWHGHLRARFDAECRRCLKPVELAIDDDVELLFSADPELADDPAVYPLGADADVVDVTPAVREELALRVSAFPLCEVECKGLCAHCGADLNAGPCGCAASGSNR